MASPVYPASLPYHQLADSFRRSEHHRDPVRTETEDGPDRVRIQSQTRFKKFSSGIKYTSDQYAIWEEFAEVTLGQATRRFIMPVPFAGAGYVNKLVYIDGAKWSDSPSGLEWVVNMTLCVLPGAPE